MGNYQELSINSFGLGLVTNPSAVDAQKNSFRVFTNLDFTKPGLAVAMPGSGLAQPLHNGVATSLPALPSSFTLQNGIMFHKPAVPGTSLTKTDCVLIFGTKGGRQRFYIWPNIAAGATVYDTTAWMELTEAEVVTVGTVASTTVFNLTGLANQATPSYYAGWIIWNNTQSRYDIVTSHLGTAQVTTATGLTGVTTGDTCVIMRFPIFKKAATVTPQYSVDTLPTYAFRSDKIVIHTGAHDINSGPDLLLQFIPNRSYFNGSFTHFNWLLEHAQPWEVRKAKYLADTINNITTPTTEDDASAVVDPIPDSTYYVIHHTFVYDGVEESNIYFDANDTFNGNHVAVGTSGNRRFKNTVKLDVRTHFERTSPYTDGTSFNTFFSKRITAMRVYLAQATAATGTSTFRPITPMFFVKEIDINSSSWSFNAGTGRYEIIYALYGRDWNEGQKYPFSLVNGYEISKAGANANFEVQVGGRAFIAPIFDDTQKLYRMLFTPLRFSGENAPEVLPVINRIDTYHHGVSEITGAVEQYDRLLLFGRNQLLVASVTGENKGQINEAYQKVGCVAHRTVKNLQGTVFFLSERYVELFDGNKVIEPPEAPFERVRDIFDGFTVAQKEAAFAGVQRNRREYWINIGGRVLIFNLLYGAISEYVSANTYIDFIEGASDGKLYGLTSSSIVELVSAAPTESLAISLKGQVFNGDLAAYRRARLTYKSPSTLLFYPIDEEQPSGMQELDPVLFLAQNEISEVDQPIGIKTERASFRLTRAASTDTSLTIDSVVLARLPLSSK